MRMQAQAAVIGVTLQLLAACTKWQEVRSVDATLSIALSLTTFLGAGALVPAACPSFYLRWRTPLMAAARVVYLSSPMFRSPRFSASVFQVGVVAGMGGQ